ncbi:hypothetical protein [Pseudoruminococcus massiliensis]|jgi:hypothetical protein|uniref:hypothetical protein n=1 Tax=Pseudoruminococcus massiliensis TaxID=2086583 RepID=UPI003AB3C19B
MDNSKLAELYAFAKICGYQGDVPKFKEEYRKYYDEFMSTIKSQPAKATAIGNPFRIGY